MLWLFDKKSFEQLAEPLKSPELEGLNEDNNHKYLAVFKALWELEEFPGDILLGYDQNIVKHTHKLNERRAEPIAGSISNGCRCSSPRSTWTASSVTPDKLLADLNAFVESSTHDKLEKRPDSGLRTGRPEQDCLLECHRQRQDAAHARQHPSVPALPCNCTGRARN